MAEQRTPRGRPRAAEKRSTYVGFKATRQELDALRRIAVQVGVSQADVLRLALRAQHPEAFTPKT